MATYAKKLQDKNGNIILPYTRSILVYCTDGTCLETRLNYLITEIGKTVPITKGGTGATSRAGAANAIFWLGVNPNGSLAKDTAAFWGNIGVGYCFLNANITYGQPNQYMIVLNLPYGNELHQIGFVQPNGVMYHRGANYSTGNMPSWHI